MDVRVKFWAMKKTSNSEQKRCKWVTDDTLYIEYHDKEWGIPVYDDQKHFEHLVLEAAQAGLSWRTVLNKREGYRKAFANFEYQKVARFNAKKVESLLKDPGIVRNRLKVEAAINNAKKFGEVIEEFGSFSNYIWSFVGNKVKMNAWDSIKKVPPVSKESEALSKDLKKRGFKFVGPTTMYAHMQALGLIHDHTTDCFRYGKMK